MKINNKKSILFFIFSINNNFFNLDNLEEKNERFFSQIKISHKKKIVLSIWRKCSTKQQTNENFDAKRKAKREENLINESE